MASRIEGETNEIRFSYCEEYEVPNSGLNTARVIVPEGRRRSQELCVKLRLGPTSIRQPSVMFFPSTAFTFSGTTTWLLLTPAERQKQRWDSEIQKTEFQLIIKMGRMNFS